MLCGRGGIGRRARLRIWWFPVQVQVLSPAPTKEVQPSVVVLLLFIRAVGLEVGAVLNDSPVDCQSRE